jgi:hypothetical protein
MLAFGVVVMFAMVAVAVNDLLNSVMAYRLTDDGAIPRDPASVEHTPTFERVRAAVYAPERTVPTRGKPGRDNLFAALLWAGRLAAQKALPYLPCACETSPLYGMPVHPSGHCSACHAYHSDDAVALRAAWADRTAVHRMLSWPAQDAPEALLRVSLPAGAFAASRGDARALARDGSGRFTSGRPGSVRGKGGRFVKANA